MTNDLRAWAYGVAIEPTKQCGPMRARLVLLVLTDHASADGRAFPSADTVADILTGTSRWDVRNAFDALERANVIARDGKVGRSIRWRILGPASGESADLIIGELAGQPATTDMAGQPAVTGELAGVPAMSDLANVAGNVAGELAGQPFSNRTEEIKDHAREPYSPMEFAVEAGYDPSTARCRRHFSTKRAVRGCGDCDTAKAFAQDRWVQECQRLAKDCPRCSGGPWIYVEGVSVGKCVHVYKLETVAA